MQSVLAGRELIAFLDHERALGNVKVVELREHLRSLGGADHLGLRVAAHDGVDHGAVVRLHVLHDHVIERTAVQRMNDVLDELTADGLVRRIEQHGLVIEQDIAVVGHPARNGEKVFKSAQAAVAAANINEIFLDLSGTVHRTTPPCFLTALIISQIRFCVYLQRTENTAFRAKKREPLCGSLSGSFVFLCLLQENILEYEQHCQDVHQRSDLLALAGCEVQQNIGDNAK